MSNAILGFLTCGVQKLGVPFWGVPIIRTIIYWGPLILGNYHVLLSFDGGLLQQGAERAVAAAAEELERLKANPAKTPDAACTPDEVHQLMPQDVAVDETALQQKQKEEARCTHCCIHTLFTLCFGISLHSALRYSIMTALADESCTASFAKRSRGRRAGANAEKISCFDSVLFA